MNIIILALFSYIFNPSVEQVEQTKLIKKFNISFLIKRTPKVTLDEKKLLKLYNDGKYSKYIKEFDKSVKKFIYVKADKRNYSKLYLYNTLSLKILGKKSKYLKSLCLIRGSLNSFENLPPFVLSEMPERCSKLKEVSIVENKELTTYINGLEIESDYVYTSGDAYNLTICKKNVCRYLRTKSKVIDKLKYSDYFTWTVKKGLVYAQKIPDSFFKYYNVEQIHFFYKKNNELYHKVKLNSGIIIMEERVSLEASNNKDLSLNKDPKPIKKQSVPIYKKWYFYAGIVAIVGVTAGGIYWYQKDEVTNTSINWK